MTLHAGMALATLFVTMPFVVRELIPILETMDLAEEEALPNIRYGLLYGIILTNAVRSSLFRPTDVFCMLCTSWLYA